MKSTRGWYLFFMAAGIGLVMIGFLTGGWKIWLLCSLVHIFGVLQGGYDAASTMEDMANEKDES